jgi:hypothetical protein
MTNCLVVPRRGPPFEIDFLFASAMRGAFHLTPPAAPVLPNQPPLISNAAARSDGFGVVDVSDDLELHR